MERNQIQGIAFQQNLGRRQQRRQPGQALWIDFFEIFGITNKRVATFELNVKKLGGEAAQCVPDARAQFSSSSLADLYDPLTMPPALLKAHQKLDIGVDAAYQPSGGKKTYDSEAHRVVFLLDLYQRITSLLPAAAGKKTRISKSSESSLK